MQVRPAMAATFFFSLLMHGVVLFFLLTFPIYSGGIHLKPYGYLRVSLKGVESVEAPGSLRTAPKVPIGKVEKAGEPVGRNSTGSSSSTRERESRHTEVKQARADVGRQERAGPPRLSIPSGAEKPAKDVTGSAGSAASGEEKAGQKKNEINTGERGIFPVITAKAEKEGEMKAIVPDLFGVPQVASVPEKTNTGVLPKTETPADKGASPEKTHEQVTRSPAESSGTPSAPQSPPEPSLAMAAGEGGKTPVEGRPAVPYDEHIPVNISPSRDGIVHEKAPAPPVLPEFPASAASSLPGPVQGIGKDENKDRRPEPKAAAGTVSVEEEIRSSVTRIGETAYGSARETSGAGEEKNKPGSILPGAAHAAGKDENKDRRPEPEAAAGTVSVEEEIRSSVTRIGETTYDSGREVSETGEKENGPKAPVSESGSDSPVPQSVTLTVPAPSPPAIKPDPALGGLLGGGPADGSGGDTPVLNTDVQIRGRDLLSEKGAGGKEQVQDMTPAAVGTGREKAAPGFPLPDAFFLRDIKIEVSLMGPEMPEVSRRLFMRPLAGGMRRAAEDNHEVTVKEETGEIVIGGRVRTEKMFSVANAGKGIYTFVMENKGEKTYEADMTFVLYGGENRERIKTYKDLRLQPGAALRFRFMLPQAVFWDDEDRFTGSIEDSDYITKFNYNSGLIWKEKKDY
jgi:hypothetical protein